MADFSTLIMANHPDLIARLKRHFEAEYVLKDGRSPLRVLKALVSSPRLADFYVRDFNSDGHVHVGDSFLDKFTMLADMRQKTYGLSLHRWNEVSSKAVMVSNYDFRDLSVTRIQVWPFDPRDLHLESLKVAVAVSYTALELVREPRIVGALNELLLTYNVQADPDELC
ncbi:hypothetical protein [Pseudomonas rhodesiae]|uniref:Uncharacterized protein n=1 Tax=Pseudomonas rhodesiae TaxID=76760 RepID=A0AAE8HFJ6_9PSED|nr:hypothetical protein [Pseudomonas rhodesiae]SDV13878.1 hypothetical protein SAMN04490209_4177 [Pseudomonas rhodesiae]